MEHIKNLHQVEVEEEVLVAAQVQVRVVLLKDTIQEV